MVEVDRSGRVQFVGGDWFALTGFTKPGAAPIKALGSRLPQDEELPAAIERAMRERVPSVFDLDTAADEADQYLMVLPIPSPVVGGQMNALVGVSDSSDVNFNPAPASSARYTVDEAPPRASTPPAVAARVGSTPSLVERAQERMATQTSEAKKRHRIPGVDWLVAGALMVFALVLRMRGLDDLPAGLHHDEAITGLEAQRVLDQSSIGFYTASAFGQPTAPFYLTAASLGLFGPSVWSLRLVSAIAGTATIALVWWVMRRRFDQPTAVAAAFALTTMTWSIHFSRIAFGVAWWPFVAFLAIAAVDRATRSGTTRDWVLAGGTVALGVYVYNSHWSVFAAVALFLLAWTGRRFAGSPRSRADLIGPLAGLGGALVTLVPILLYAQRSDTSYGNHFDAVSRRTEAVWTDAGFFGKVRVQFDWYIESWNVLLFNNRQDGDASGIIKMVPLIFTVLAVVGLITVLWRHRTAFVGLVIAVIIVLPLGASMTRNGLTRRDYAMAPFIAVLIGIGAVAIWRFARARTGEQPARLVAAAMAALMIWTGVVPYFTDFRDDTNAPWVFSEELTIAADFIDDAEAAGPVYVNWYSRRHYYDYPTLDYLVDAPGSSRMSLDAELRDDPPDFSALPDVTGDQLFMMIGDFVDNLDELREQYPNGELVASNDGPRILAYRVPG